MTSSMKGESIPCVDIVCITEFGKRKRERCRASRAAVRAECTYIV